MNEKYWIKKPTHTQLNIKKSKIKRRQMAFFVRQAIYRVKRLQAYIHIAQAWIHQHEE